MLTGDGDATPAHAIERWTDASIFEPAMTF